jgi:Ca2+-binding RTX toxin-like protein
VRRITLLLTCMALLVGVTAAVAYAANIVGTNGPDTLIGTPQHDEIRGRGGSDLIKSKAGNDDDFGNTGGDTILAQADDDFASGGDGSDDVRGNAGDDILLGGDGSDDISGGSGDEEQGSDPGVFGGDGNDFINLVDGVAENDFADCGSGDDDTVRVDRDGGNTDDWDNCENVIRVDV